MKPDRILIVLFVLLLGNACANVTFEESDINLIPQPQNIELNEGVFKIKTSTKLVITDPDQQKSAIYLQDLMGKSAGFKLPFGDDADTKNIIRFEKNSTLKAEGYELDITSESITIKAATGAGWFYGVQTLRQLLPLEVESNDKISANWIVPCVLIKDEPRFKWRGMMIDFSRHFFSIDEVKEYLDHMALYKLNTYHMHLTDGQGWRIEIKKYPLLTEKGAWRIESNNDRECLEKAKTNETFIIDEKHYHQVDGKRMYGGFFTQNQIREIIAYAADRYITVVPEIDMPGHFNSATDNYPWLKCKHEVDFKGPACLGQETTYEFAKNVLAEIAGLFPGEYVHIGGDEVSTRVWKECEKCQATIRKHKLKNEHELHSHFNQVLEEFLNRKGKRLVGWDEIVEGGVTTDATVMWCRSWIPEIIKKAADNGNEMVLSPAGGYYFDHMNEAVSLERVYNREPIPASTPVQEKQVIGIQANLWSERIPNYDRLQIQTFPRMLALAETAWFRKGEKNYNKFYNKVKNHFPRLELMSVNYFMPPISGTNKTYAFTDSAKIELGVAYENAKIYYTLDGSDPTRNSILYIEPFYVSKDAPLIARAISSNVVGEKYYAKIEKQEWLQAKVVTLKEQGFKCWVAEKKFTVVEEVDLPETGDYTTVKTIDMGEYSKMSQYSMVFRGYFNVKEQGIYEFSTNSDDGSLLYIGDKLVVDNGGNHTARLHSGMVALKAGSHPITIVFHQAGGGGFLEVKVAKPGEKPKPLDFNDVSF